ncbi:MAG: TetR/AcrR family transcriptional regulator, partial [Clostridiales bacterium]|nr:TetR/AcrR family transcriptional regulator [Clostridiales bacterium]
DIRGVPMPAPNPHTLEKIQQAGKQEFLEKGYQNASLRAIAAAAGVTTGAIYGYYPDKEALFCALVEPCATELMRYFKRSQEEFDRLPSSLKMDSMHGYSSNSMDEMLDYIYAHLDAFRLIIKFSEGTAYADYLDTLVAIEEDSTMRFIDVLESQGHPVHNLDEDIVHSLCSAHFHGMFQMVAHDIPKERAIAHVHTLMQFYTAGWDSVLGL